MKKKFVKFFDLFKRKNSGDSADESVLQTSEDRSAARRNKAILMLVTAAGLFFMAISLADVIKPMFQKKSSQDEQKMLRLLEPPKGAVQGESTGKEKLRNDWRTVIETKLGDNDNKFDQVFRKFDEISQKLDENGKASKKQATKTGFPEKPLSNVAPIPVKNSNSTQDNKPQDSQGTQAQKSMPAQQQSVPVNQQPTFRRIEFKLDKPEAKKTSTGGAVGKNDKDTIDLPIGLAVGLTLNGMDAPTFQWGQQDPQPLLTSIEDKMITAMGEEIDLKGCMVLSSTHGAVSAEKAMPRLVKMNCRDKNGNLYAGAVKGWILGDDGKVGMTGRLVTRNGAVLSKIFWADILSLGGSYLRASATTTSTSLLGVMETTKDSDLLKSAAGQTAEKTTGRLAQFYIKIAEQIYPVVEVKPGRTVTVLFEYGRLIKVTKDNFEEINKIAQKTNTEKKKEN
ncbi:MAG: hypothetical protein A2X55_08865 [Nitrospirae bacterium GWB2_47_37]|nr:MAG: hypothetical protein A2X55_08865 [Nitrospirae bacterium GWB2_47_37]